MLFFLLNFINKLNILFVFFIYISYEIKLKVFVNKICYKIKNIYHNHLSFSGTY